MLAKEMYELSNGINKPFIPREIMDKIKLSAEQGKYAIKVENLKDNHIKGLKLEGFTVKKLISLFDDIAVETNTYEISWKLD